MGKCELRAVKAVRMNEDLGLKGGDVLLSWGGVRAVRSDELPLLSLAELGKASIRTGSNLFM